MAIHIRRREFIVMLGGAAGAWPLAARAQQPMPVLGLLLGGSAAVLGPQIAAFHEGLRQAGFAEGQNVIVEYRSALGRYERLPEMATDLVRRQVAVIFATGSVPAPLAAKAATTDAADVKAGDAERLRAVAAIAHKPAGLDLFALLENRRNRVAGRQSDKLIATAVDGVVGAGEESADP